MRLAFMKSLALFRSSSKSSTTASAVAATATSSRRSVRCLGSKSSSSSSSDTAAADAASTVVVGRLADRLNGLDQPTVWHEFSPLAAEYQAINLGQGFPDWQPPDFVRQALRDSTTHQYARSAAHLPLATVLVQDYQERWKEECSDVRLLLDMDPLTQVATTVGCTNGLYCAIQGLINPGDEVVLLEPAFDIYHAAVKMAGGIPVPCPLRPQEVASDHGNAATPVSASHVFALDVEEFERCLTPRTKMFILNTPHNVRRMETCCVDVVEACSSSYANNPSLLLAFFDAQCT